jgi:heat-inducible transcriptional repressor
VVHRFCELPRRLSPSEVTQLSNLLDAHLREVPIGQVLQTAIPAEEAGALDDVVRLLAGVIQRGVEDEDGDLVIDGASHMLEQPEFREANRVEPLVRFLEERQTAYQALRQLLAKQALLVSIGQENPHEAMREVSVVAARYGAGSRMFGWVGVLGPTRMHYPHAVSAVHYAARALTETLTRFGIE